MKTLDRKLLREVFAAKGLLLAITSIIAVGVVCYVAFQSAYHNLNEAKRRYYRQCRMADFWIDLKKVPVSDLDLIADLSGVTEIHSRIQFAATVDIERVVEPLNGYVLSLPDRRNHTLNDVVMLSGSYFTDERQNQVIVNDAFARQHDLHAGEWIHLILNNRRQELFIVGTAISSEFTYLLGPGAIMPDPKRYGVFYIKRTYAEEVFDFEGAANQVLGALVPKVRERPDEVLRQAEHAMQPYGVFAATPRKLQASNQYLSNEIAGLKSFASVTPVIFLAVAALVLNVLLTRLARQQRIVIGTLKALGYTDAQVFLHFLKFGTTVGLAGGVIGSLLGFACGDLMTRIYRLYFEFPELASGVYPYTYVIAISVSLLCAAAGSLHGAWNVLRLAPAEAMRPAPPKIGRPILLERFGLLWRRLDVSWRMALRSLFRSRFRTAVGLFAAAMGAGLLVCGFMMHEATNFFVDFQFHRVNRSDVDLAFKDERPGEALGEVRDLPGVDYAEPLLQVACTFRHGPYHRKGGITGIVPDARLTVPRDANGTRLRIPSAGLVMTRRLAEILHVRSGDTVTIVPVKGERRPRDLPVAEIADSYMGMAVYADLDYLSRQVGEESAMSGAQLAIDGDPQHTQQLYRAIKRLPQVQSVTTRREMIEMLRDTIIKNQMVFIVMVVIFAGTIFFGSIVNASLVSLAERQQEVATFVALGYSPWQIGGMFLRESMFTNITGTLIGLPIGYFLTWLTVLGFNNDLLRFPLVTAPWIWITTLVLAVVFALLAHVVVQWKIHHMDYLAALKVQE